MTSIGFFESIEQVIRRVEQILAPACAASNMTLSVLPISGTPVAPNTVELKTFGVKIEPAPVTPVEGRAFDLMGGTIKHLFPGTIVVPSAMTAFTDTQCEYAL